jgi:hypothetical protein
MLRESDGDHRNVSLVPIEDINADALRVRGDRSGLNSAFTVSGQNSWRAHYSPFSTIETKLLIDTRALVTLPVARMQ